MLNIEPKHCENPKNRDKVEEIINLNFEDEHYMLEEEHEKIIEELKKIGENRFARLYEKYKDPSDVVSALNGSKLYSVEED